MRAPRPAPVAHPGRARLIHVPGDRDVLQPDPTPLHPRLPKPGGLRDHRYGMITTHQPRPRTGGTPVVARWLGVACSSVSCDAAAAMRVIRARAASQRQRSQERWRPSSAHPTLTRGPSDSASGSADTELPSDRITAPESPSLAGSSTAGGTKVSGSPACPPGAVRPSPAASGSGSNVSCSPAPTTARAHRGRIARVRGARRGFDPHGGSPRFGSSFVVLHRQVLDRSHAVRRRQPHAPGRRRHRRRALVDPRRPRRASRAEANCSTDRSTSQPSRKRSTARTGRPVRARELDGYVEAQVHGGVSLAGDVTEFVVDPSFSDTAVADDLPRTADSYGFALSWHRGSEMHVDRGA